MPNYKENPPETLEEYVEWARAGWVPDTAMLQGSDGNRSKILRDEAVRRGYDVDLSQYHSKVQVELIKTRSGLIVSNERDKSELMAVLKACFQAWKAEES